MPVVHPLIPSLSFSISNIPSALLPYPHWLNWQAKPKYDQEGNIVKYLKIPTKQHWQEQQQPLASLPSSPHFGLGFVYLPTHPFICIDVDDLSPTNQQLIADLNTYTEVSPSGAGLHAIIQLPTSADKQQIIDVFGTAKHFKSLNRDLYISSGYTTMTGTMLDPASSPTPVRVLSSDKALHILDTYFGTHVARPGRPMVPKLPKLPKLPKQPKLPKTKANARYIKSLLKAIPVKQLESDVFDRMTHGQSIVLNDLCQEEARTPWLIIGLALHDNFNGSLEGYKLWSEWSQLGNKYDADALNAAWESFDSPEPTLSADNTAYWTTDQQPASPLPRVTIASLIALAQAQTIGFPDVNAKGVALGTILNFQAYLAHNNITVATHELTKQIMVSVPPAKEEEWNLPVDLITLGNATTCISSDFAKLPVMQSAFSQSNIKAFLKAQATSTMINPIKDYFINCGDQYTGQDHLHDLLATIIPQADYAKYGTSYLRFLRKWLIQAVAAACHPADQPARLNRVLIFTGDQGVGKTKWVESLFPPEIRKYCAGDKDIKLSKFKSDSTKLAMELSNTLICNINEIDRVFTSSAYADFKAFLDQTSDNIVLPYGDAPVEMTRRTVFIGSCNTSIFLRDLTGNRRIEIIHVDRLHHDHNLDLTQLWGQAYHMYTSGEAWWLEESNPDDKLARVHRDEINNSAMAILDDDYAELLDETFDASQPHLLWQELELRDLKAILSLGSAKHFSQKKFKMILNAWLRSHKFYIPPYQKNRPKGAMFYTCPPLRSASEYIPLRALSGAELQEQKTQSVQ